MIRLSKWYVVAVVVAAAMASPALAIESVGRGKIKSIDPTKSEFVLTDANNKDFTFAWAETTKVRAAGKEAKVTDLKPNDEVSLVFDKGVTKNTAEFVYVHKDGKDEELGRGAIKAINDKNELVLTDLNNKEWTFKADTSKIELAGKEGKLSDLKAGDKVTVIFMKKGNDLMLKEAYK
jgi:Cu/Ag efflux protein CusF